MKTTNTKPPIEIFDILHECEKHGIELPQFVDDWWFFETVISEEEKDSRERGKNEKSP